MKNLDNKSLIDQKNAPTSSPLGEINKLFHSSYKQRKQEIQDDILSGEYLIFVRMDDRIIVLKGNTYTEYTLNDESYHKLKACCHFPVAVYYLLSNCDSQEGINNIKSSIAKLKEEEQEEPILNMIEIVEKWMAQINDNKELVHAKILGLSEQLEAVFAKAMASSAKREIVKTLKVLDEVYAQYNTPASKTFLLSVGGHQPRYKQLAKLVFEKWFSEKDDYLTEISHHVRYCEGSNNLDDALDVLATALADREIGQLFLGSSSALNQDVLGIVAQNQIDKIWATRHSN